MQSHGNSLQFDSYEILKVSQYIRYSWPKYIRNLISLGWNPIVLVTGETHNTSRIGEVCQPMAETVEKQTVYNCYSSEISVEYSQRVCEFGFSSLVFWN